MTELVGTPAVQATGYALVAFLWQGAAIGVAAACLAVVLRRATPQVRYAVACIALAVMALAPILTVASRLDDRSLGAPRERATSATIPPHATTGDLTADSDASIDDHAAAVDNQLALVVLVWSVGVMLVGLHFAGGRVMVARLRRFASPVADAIHRKTFERLAHRLAVAMNVELLSSSRLEVPAVIGWLRPAIILPVSTLAGLSPSHLEAILAHELAHVRRRDYLVNVLQCLVETLLFYHPAVWWVSGWIRREREHCCDDVAAAVCESRIGYAHALRALEELRHVPLSLAVGARGGDLVARIRRLVGDAPDPLPNWSGGLAMIVPILALLTIGAHAGAQQAMPQPAPVPQVGAVRANIAPRLVSPPDVDAVRSDPAPQPGPLPHVDAFPADSAPRKLIPQASGPQPAPEAPRRVVTSPGTPTGQVTNGLDGVVTDPLGGLLPGATLTLRSSGGQQIASAVTNAAGRFTFLGLPEGDYDVAVSLPGFHLAHEAVRIGAGVHSSVVVKMQIGELAEEVTVISPASPQPPTGELPATLQTAADYRTAAMYYYQREAFPDAEAMIDRASDLTRAELMPADAPAAPHPAGVQWVGGSVKVPRKIRDVKPVFPSAAVTAAAEGVVTIKAVIDRAGTVSGAVVTSAPSAFDQAALDAVRQWLFTPTELNRIPIDVFMNVTISFKKN